MTTMLERSRRVHAAAEPDPRPGRSARRRVELRLATRQTMRAWPVSLLVIALVALPLMLLSGAATFATSRIPADDQKITVELGRTAAWYMIVGGADPSRSQSLDDPYWNQVDTREDGTPVNPEQPAPDDLDGLVSDPTLLSITTAEVMARTPGGAGSFHAVAGDAADALLEGRYELLDGRPPAGADEALVSPGALARLDAEIGDTLELTDPAASLTIVGVLKEAIAPDDEQTLFFAASALSDEQIDPLRTLWFSPEQQPTSDEIDALNRAGVIAYARDLVAAGGGAGYVDPSTSWVLTSGTIVIGGFIAYLVILLAGAGFAVSAKRQERSLAVAASVGAGRGSVFRIVLLQGTVLGLLGGVLGTALGVALAHPTLALFDDGAASSFWGFHVPWIGLALLVLFATAIGTASALIPARAATRGDVLASLRGSRKPAVVRVSRPFWGSLIIAIGLVATLLSGLGLAALNNAVEIDYADPRRTLCVIGIVAGPLLFQIGAIVAGHWLLSLAARGASHLGLAPRIAARDVAAHPGRVVPAFAAIAACVFIASAALTAVAVNTQQQARNWWYQAPLGSVVVSVWGDGDPAMASRAEEALAQTEPDDIAAIRHEVGTFGGTAAYDGRVSAEIKDYIDCAATEQGPCLDRGTALFGQGVPIVVTPEDLETVLGIDLDASEITRFEDGGALVTDPAYLDEGQVVLHRWNVAEVDAFYEEWEHAPSLPEPLETTHVAAQSVALQQQRDLTVILSPAAAEAFGIETEVHMLIGAYDERPTAQQLDRLALVAGQQWMESGFSYALEQGPPSPAPWLWLILGAAGVLVLGAGGVALGLARVERRPDDATLTAVGASPGIRRGIAFWQALLIVGIGSVTGTVAGLIPVWGITMMSQSDPVHALLMADAPWLWLGLLAIGLPLVVAAVSWLIPSRRADLTRRTVIA